MQSTNDSSPENSWNTIHDTMDQSRSSMYLAGVDTILLMWGGLMALGYLGQFAILSLASDFADRSLMDLRSILVGYRRDRYGCQQHHRTPREQEPI